MEDETLSDLGPVPGDVEALIERYLGSRRITAAQADSLLAELGRGAAPAPVAVPPAPRSPGRRYNTPFPQGIAGADDLPLISPRTPLPGFYPPVAPLAVAPASVPAPAVFSTEPAFLPLSEPPPAPPAAASATPERREDSFEILVDDDMLELEPDDLLIEDADDNDEP